VLGGQEDEANATAQSDSGDIRVVMNAKVISENRNVDFAVQAFLDHNEVLEDSEPGRTRGVTALAEVVLHHGVQTL
jgi:hypothetical protein